VTVSETLLFRKVYGSIVGCAIGDSMGHAVETMHYKDIEEKAGKVTGFIKQFHRERDLTPRHRPYYETLGPSAEPLFTGRTRPYGPFKDLAGAYTDDTRVQLLYYQAIVRKGGRVTPEDVAREFLEYRLTFLSVSKQPTFQWHGGELERIMIETHGWFSPCEAFRSPKPFHSNGVDAPAGLINAFDPARAAEDGYVVAAAVAEAMKPDATVESIIQAVLANAGCLGGRRREFTARVERLLDIARGQGRLRVAPALLRPLPGHLWRRRHLLAGGAPVRPGDPTDRQRGSGADDRGLRKRRSRLRHDRGGRRPDRRGPARQ
jgi:ADP-ribosylglycohydrolase